MSTSQINRLGERLRKSTQPAPKDTELLDVYRETFGKAYQTVDHTLRERGLEASSRIKTTVSIVEKLKRESIRLSRLQDIAGFRVIVDHIADQDMGVSLIVDAFSQSTVVDRRLKPSHNYRAVHVIVDIDGRLVEIQVRTELQHLWARWSEAWAALLGQSIKYGTGPQELQETLKLESEMVAMIESYEKILSESYETVERRQLTHVSALKTVLSGQPLTEGQLDELLLVGYLENLVLQRRNMKDWLTREILELDRERHGS